MPVAGSSNYGLVIFSLGIIGVILSFLIADRKKYIGALSLSLFVVGLGLFEFVGSSLRHWRTSRRIARLQEQQKLNLEALQTRLREATEKARTQAPSAPAPAAPKPAPAASSNKKK